jgi:hypothetical protein
MRAVETKKYLYIFNAWSDGETAYRNESQDRNRPRLASFLARVDTSNVQEIGQYEEVHRS